MKLPPAADSHIEPPAPISFSSVIKPAYQPHLDGLRALAIVGVLFEHFGLILPPLLRFGPLSVRFFFVLSGYFITLALWRLQASALQSETGQFSHLWKFYLARLLRIGPPFYLALVLGALFGIEEVRTNFFWLATFQANHYVAQLGYWPNSIAHFWSLAIQEQFYVLWPLVVLTLPRRWFLPMMGAFILFGLGYRIFCVVTDAPTITRWVALFGCIDSFAVGALVAYLAQARLLERMRTLSRTMLVALPLAAFSCYFLGRALMTLPEHSVWIALTESCDAIFLAWLLTVALGEIRGIYRAVLSWTPLVYLGRISYGIYVYHVFVIILVSPLLVTCGLSESHDEPARLLVLFLLTVALASLSWHWLEQPFLSWKYALGERRPEPALEPPGLPLLAR